MTALFDRELEWGVVIACCTEPDVVGPVLARVRSEDFRDDEARRAMTRITVLHAAGEVVDKALVARELRGTEAALLLFDAGLELPVPQSAPGHARHLRKLSLLRRLHVLGSDLRELADPDADPEDVIAESIARLRLAGEQIETDELTIADLVEQNERTIDSEALTGAIRTGLPRLDERLDGGLRPTRLYVVGARPGVGKSALVTNWIRLALDEGRTVLFLSLEMTGSEVLTRLVVDKFRIDGRPGDPSHTMRLLDAMHSPAVGAWRLKFFELATIGRLVRRARELQREDLGLVVVDYVQLFPSESRRENRALEVASFTRALKLLAMELRVPVVAISQLNREMEKGAPRKPRLSDLRESGALEQDANVVILLHRDVDHESREAELAVAKNRHGRTGIVPLVFDAEHLRFRERALEAV